MVDDNDAKPEGSLSETISFSSTAELKNEIRALAEERGRSMSNLLRELVGQAIKSEKEDPPSEPAEAPARETPAASFSSDDDPDGYGELLLAGGPVLIEDLQSFLSDKRYRDEEFSEVLLEQSCPSREELAGYLGREFQPPFMDLDEYEIHPEVIKILPEQQIREHTVLPVAQVGPVLCVTQIPPFDDRSFQLIHRETGFKIFPVRCDEKQIREAFQTYYDFSREEIQSFILERKIRLPGEVIERLEAVQIPEEYRSIMLREMRRDHEKEWEKVNTAEEPLQPVSTSGVVEE